MNKLIFSAFLILGVVALCASIEFERPSFEIHRKSDAISDSLAYGEIQNSKDLEPVLIGEQIHHREKRARNRGREWNRGRGNSREAMSVGNGSEGKSVCDGSLSVTEVQVWRPGGVIEALLADGDNRLVGLSRLCWLMVVIGVIAP
ncbi:hypothetical protein Fcan01_16634 [Folsomia candida]|uniref:Uncharacterized protein n=1 Tax=Folsomia candida TaxID=158441 RepID=A0A226DUS3_FOLCA|nr:hypothetical protein Fcan01_16634 [Folsomia candida]